ncbi:MAG: universal stress protein [Gammaproteobacteria bacterium]|jgi:universal stress protein A
MKTYKRLLVPVDFSDASVAAFTAARDLCAALEGEMKVVHIHQLQVPYVGDGGFYVPEMDEDEVLKERENELADFVKKHGENDVEISREVRLGDPETEINEMAGEYQADLIIMGTHGRTGLSHLLMGSVTESVLRHANVPILAVRHK